MQGGEILLGGTAPESQDLTQGYYVNPTIVRIEPTSQVACEEVFGPFMTVHTFSTDEEALEIASGREIHDEARSVDSHERPKDSNGFAISSFVVPDELISSDAVSSNEHSAYSASESESETDLFVNYVAILKDDGESASGAIAISRGWAIATDDKQATNLFRREKPNLEILSTPEILQYWAEKKKISDQDLKNVLKSVRVKGRYSPPREHPLANWWASITQN
jgi:hypothetical protein